MSLIETVEHKAQQRTLWLKQAKAAVRLAHKLPSDVQELDAALDQNHSGNYDFWTSKGTEAQLILECHGAIFDKPIIDESNGDFFVKGSWEYKRYKIDIHISNVVKPPDCQVYTVKEVRTVYRSTCDDKKEAGGEPSS